MKGMQRQMFKVVRPCSLVKGSFCFKDHFRYILKIFHVTTASDTIFSFCCYSVLCLKSLSARKWH